jgi:hemerythrin
MPAEIVWQSYYSVDEPSLDAEHRQIIGIINDLYVAMEQGKDRAVLKTLLNRLVQYTDVHFQHEERLMREHDYPGLREHKALHEELRRRTVDLRAHTELITGRDLLNFLKNWWMDHIRSEDKQYAPYLGVSARSEVLR